MKIKTLFRGIENIQIKGSKEVDINGICTDSKKVCLGNIFFALKGNNVDGAEYILEAVDNGALAVVSQIYNPFIKKRTQIICSDPFSLLFPVVEHFFNYPSKKIFLAGITGTNGKTTITYIIQHLFQKENKLCGVIGTNQYQVGEKIYPATFTTPPFEITNKLLKEMLYCRCDSAVMEVSSHALEQKRCDRLAFDALIFTNLTPEHLDYHKNMSQYAQSKKKLFTLLDKSEKPNKIAIVNKDCTWHSYMIEGLHTPVLTYGIEQVADIWAFDIDVSSKGLSFSVLYNGEKEQFCSSFIGRFNVYNLLAVIALGCHRGLSLQELSFYIRDCQPVAGRMEKVSSSVGDIYVDYAHTPDALKNSLCTLQEIKKKRLIVVFGCGGNRDMDKRPLMGQVAHEHADVVIVTSDNPRREDPHEIIQQIVQGFARDSNFFVEVDRARAIALAIEMAKKDDLILIAGKGHETTQVVKDTFTDFDDKEIIHKILHR